MAYSDSELPEYNKLNVAVFIDMLENQASLFSEEELKDLKTKAKDLPNDINIEELDEFISNWCQNNIKIRLTQSENVDNFLKHIPISIPNRKIITDTGSYVLPSKLDSDITKGILLNGIEKAIESNDKKQ